MKMNITAFSLSIAIGMSAITNVALAAGTAQSPSSAQVAASRAILNPIFLLPVASKSALVLYFVGRNSDIVSSMDWSEQADVTRMKEILQIARNFKLQKPGSATALPLGESLLKLLLEHAYYIDNLRAFESVDKAFRNTEAAARTAYKAVAVQAENLAKQFPKSHQIPQWKAEAAISRLRVAAPEAQKNALNYLRTNKGVNATRLQVVGCILDHLRGQVKSSFGTLHNLIESSPEDTTKGSLTLLVADETQNKKEAIARYQEAARLTQNFRGPQSKVNPIVHRAVAQSVALALLQNPNDVDSEIISFVQSQGVNSAGHAYAEQVALKATAKHPRQAISLYQSILEQPGISPRQTLFVEHRALDIALNAEDCESADAQWDRITKLPANMSVTGAPERVLKTQRLCWGRIEKDPSVENVDRFVRLHDLFVTLSPSYKKDESWSINVIDGLYRSQRDSLSAGRADALVNSSQKPLIQISALRFAAKARERMMSLPAKPDFKISRKISDASVATAYISTLERIFKLGTSEEKLNATFQIPYVLHVIENADSARTKFEGAMAAFSRTEQASKTVSYLLEINLTNKDHVYTERIARYAEKLGIKPFDKAHSDLRKIVENAVWDQAVSLENSKQYVPAGDRFSAFQKEFPSVKRSDMALDLSAKNYLRGQQVDIAILHMERLLTTYPNSIYAKETRWNAAEQSKGIKQYVRAATHYEVFGKDWPSEGIARKTFYKAGEMQRLAGRYANSASDFEKYFSQATTKPERVKTAKDIASLHVQFGKTSDAIGGLDRFIKISGNVEDEFWALAQMLDLYIRDAQNAQVRQTALKLLSLPPSGEDAAKIQARAKFELGKMEATEIRGMEPMKNPRLLKASQELLARYEKAKTNLAGPCEANLSQWCSVSLYETSRLAEDVAKILLDVEPPPSLDPKEADQIQNLRASRSEKLQQEVRSYADQAEAALTKGVPDQDWADRIRQWAQNQRGENQTVDPVYK